MVLSWRLPSVSLHEATKVSLASETDKREGRVRKYSPFFLRLNMFIT